MRRGDRRDVVRLERLEAREPLGAPAGPGRGARALQSALRAVLVPVTLALPLCFAPGAYAVAEGQISGVVTRAVGGTPIAGIEVCAIPAKTGAKGFACKETDANGAYTTPLLPAGEYYVGFGFESTKSQSVYLPQFWDDAPSLETATAVTVTAGSTTPGIDAKLQEGGRIAGRVTDGSTGTPLGTVLVCAMGREEFELFGCEETNANGEYTIPGLATGEYTVTFTAFGEYLPRETHNVMVVAPNTTPGVNAALVPTGTPPADITPPSVSGLPAVGSILVCANGRWTGTPAPTFAHQWLRDGAPIPGVTANAYMIQSADTGHTLSCVVTAKNARGQRSAASAGVAIPVPAPLPPPPPPQSPPVVQVVGSGVVVAGGSARVTIACGDARCQGAARLSVPVVNRVRRGHRTFVRRRALLLASGSFALAEGQRAHVVLHLTSAGRRRLARAKRHPVTATLTVSVHGGKTIAKSVRIT